MEDLNTVIIEISRLLPQLGEFITQFNNLVSSSGVNVLSDAAGNMSVDIPTTMNNVDASQVVRRLGIIDRLINTHGTTINELLQQGLDMEKQIKTTDSNYTSRLTQQIQEFKALNSSYKH
jgi:hypothetical protein